MISIRGAIWFGLAATAWLSAGPATSAELSSRYRRVGVCRETGHGVDQDWILKTCGGYPGQPVWIAYSDSTKAHVGFGPKQNVSGTFGTVAVETARLEWRGLRRGAKFEPFAVIIRLREPFDETGKSALVVYRLRLDGTSCIIGRAQRSNAKAREIADASLAHFLCEDEPDRP
jgi:hypothetical protein